MLTIGYIGNGKSTNRYHIPFAQKVEGIAIKKICTRREGIWGKLDGTEYVTEKEALYTDDDIQLVVICTPAKSHYSLAKEALEHGKHVLLEKPFVETGKEARALFALAKDKNLFLQCYQNRRFDADFLTTQKVIESRVLGALLEVEMHFDYFRPEIPESVKTYNRWDSYVYGHACHTIDQAISYFGIPLSVHWDVRQLLGEHRMNDYFDYDFYYENGLKVSIKSSFFRIEERPSFVVYGKNGCFLKRTKDRQEEHLKLFYMPTHLNFGVDLPEHYGVLTYMDGQGHYHKERVVSEVGDYSRIYQGVYDSIVHNKEKIVNDEETIYQIDLLEESTAQLN